MSTLVRTEVGRDQRGNKFQTNVSESFTTMVPDTAASSWTLTQADGIFTLTETYTEQVPDPGGGGGGGGTTFPDIWSLDLSTVTEPIETHPRFQSPAISDELMRRWTQWKIDRIGNPTTWGNERITALYIRFNRGTTDYLSPRIVLKLQKVFSSPPADLARVGYAFGKPTGCPFDFSTSVNFLFTGATCVQEGTNYRVTAEWLTSKPGGWDALLYNVSV
jgi:hypothetical protein